jgi:molecular chaperone GrpE
MDNELIEDQNHEELLNGETTGETTHTEEEKKDKSLKSKHRKDPKTEKLEEELAVANDKYLRLYSEFDNYRKRTLKEKIELGKTASADVIIALLPIVDDFERGLKAFDTSGDAIAQALKDGMFLIYTKLTGNLLQLGLEPINSIGEEFNTDFHEAITNIPAPTPEQKGKVVDEIIKGYMLNGKVIRFAQVVVGS